MKQTLAICAVGTLWLVGVATALVPIPFGGSFPALVLSALLWTAIIAGCCAIGILVKLRWLTAVGVTGAVVLGALSFNWVLLAPRTWFEVHRPFYEAALADVDRSKPGSYYGDLLPGHLMWLTSDGRASVQVIDLARGSGPEPLVVFFPQWVGMPDDAGGYFYSPDIPPVGADMYGMLCMEPEDLGDGWWMCGMTGNSDQPKIRNAMHST